MHRKPSTNHEPWYIVRFRAIKTFTQVTGYLSIKNGYHAGHDGWSRRTQIRRWNGEKTRVFRRRDWTISNYRDGRLSYRFADLKDINATLKSDYVRSWCQDHDVMVEIVKQQGCRFTGRVDSQTIVQRKFPRGTNEMEILAIECELGEE